MICSLVTFYHSEKLQSTKTMTFDLFVELLFYHSEKLQSTKTKVAREIHEYQFYHSEKLQSTKTDFFNVFFSHLFYHSEKLQSTKTYDFIKYSRRNYGAIISGYRCSSCAKFLRNFSTFSYIFHKSGTIFLRFKCWICHFVLSF